MNRKYTSIGLAGITALFALLITILVFAPRNPEKIVAQAQATQIPSGSSGVLVQGSGAVYVKPDIIKFYTGVEAKAPTVTDAQKQASAKSQTLVDAVKDQGVKEEDIQTSSYDILPNYVYVQNQPPRLDGYTVRNQFVLTVRDITKAGAIIDAAGTGGASQVGGITFTLDNNQDAVKQARQAAMADAKNKADQLAAGGGFTLGGIISVTELGGTNPPKVQMAGSQPGAAGIASAPLAPAPETIIEGGQFKVLVNVQVAFAIKS